jgi:hypothetical protein
VFLPLIFPISLDFDAGIEIMNCVGRGYRTAAGALANPISSTRIAMPNAPFNSLRICLSCGVVVLLLLLFLAPAAAGELRVHSDFPGGSAEVLEIDQAARRVRITPKEGPGWDCWWYFRLSGLEPGETVTVELAAEGFARPDRAAVSLDGSTWTQTPAGMPQGAVMQYRQQVTGPEARFAWGPVFVLSDAEAMIEDLKRTSARVEPFELCRTRGGHPVPAVRIAGDETTGNRPVVWIQARQHAWESGSSWVARGLAEWWTSDEPRGKALRARADLALVPIMDVDNVMAGAGGKEELPQDHNRDWSDMPHWRSVAAAQSHIGQLIDAGRLALFVDLHNPGPTSRHPFYYVSPDEMLSPAGRDAMARLLEASTAEITGPLTLSEKPQVSGSTYDPARWRNISKNWVTERSGGSVASVTLETSWNTPHSTTEGYRTVGRQLGLAIERFLPK